MKTLNRRVVAGFAAALLLTAPLAISLSAYADTPSTTTTVSPIGNEAPLLSCTDGGGVFVVVTMEDGSTTAACVQSPESGTAALLAAGFTIGRDATQMICSINNYPNPCPATFNGKYWQYYQASGADAAAGNWAYATNGSDDTKPEAGWVEGWCYGETCEPAYPGTSTVLVSQMPVYTFTDPPTTTAATDQSATPPAQAAPTRFAYTKWIIAGVIVVVVMVIIVGVGLTWRSKSEKHAA